MCAEITAEESRQHAIDAMGEDLGPKVETGTRLQLVHSGFVTPKNDSALKSMGDGWKKVVPNIGSIANELGEKN